MTNPSEPESKASIVIEYDEIADNKEAQYEVPVFQRLMNHNAIAPFSLRLIECVIYCKQ